MGSLRRHQAAGASAVAPQSQAHAVPSAGSAGVLSAAILVAVLIGWLAGHSAWSPNVLVFLGSVVVALIHPVLAVCLLTLSFTLEVVNLGGVDQTLARMSGCGVGVILLPQVIATWVRRNRGRPIVTATGAFLVGLLAFSALSGAFADDRDAWLQGIWMLCVRASLFACVVHFVQTARHHRAVLGAVATALAGAALTGIIQWTWGMTLAERVFRAESGIGGIRASGVFENPIGLSFALVPALGCAVYFVVHGRRFARLGGATATPLLLFALATTMTRSAALGAFLLVALVFVLPPALPRWGKAAVVGAIIGAVLVAPAPVKKRFADPNFLGEERSVHNRLPMSITAMRMAAANPLGVGLRNFERHYDEYKLIEDTESRRAGHNMYLELAATIGIPGVLCLIGWIAAMLVSLNRSRRVLLAAHTSPEAALTAFLFAIVAAMALQGLFHTIPYQDKFFWLFMALGQAGTGLGARAAGHHEGAGSPAVGAVASSS